MLASVRSLRQSLVFVLLIGWSLVCLFPLYWMILTAVLPTSQILSRSPAFVPALADLNGHAFVAALTRRPLVTWLGNSLLVTVGATTLSLVIAALAGYSLSRFRTRAQQLTGLTLLLTKMLPGSLIVIPFFIMASTFHLVDSLWALMLANAACLKRVPPFVIFSATSALHPWRLSR